MVAGTNDPDTALRHLQQILEAKNERARQPPAYPAANAHTGRPDTDPHAATKHDDIDPHEPDTVTNHPSPDAIYGANGSHARGNQGMRKQR